ncbi:MAG: hypothetical protein ACRDD4_10955 [Culicoidibacterales bacterium]
MIIIISFNYRNNLEDYIYLNKYMKKKKPATLILLISMNIVYFVAVFVLILGYIKIGRPLDTFVSALIIYLIAWLSMNYLLDAMIEKIIRTKMKKEHKNSKHDGLYAERKMYLSKDRMILTNLETLAEKDIARSDIGSVIRDKDYIYIYKYEDHELLAIVHSCYIPEEYYDDFCIWMNIRK